MDTKILQRLPVELTKGKGSIKICIHCIFLKCQIESTNKVIIKLMITFMHMTK